MSLFQTYPMAMVTTLETNGQPRTEKKMRRQWKSFNIDRSISNPENMADTNIGNESPSDSPILDDFFSQANLKVNGGSYGKVIPIWNPNLLSKEIAIPYLIYLEIC